MDSALIRDRARLRRDELLRKAERLESFLQILDELTEQDAGEGCATLPITECVRASEPELTVPQEVVHRDVAHQMSHPTSAIPFADPDEIVRNVREILIEIGRPMVRRELAERLIERGLRLKGRDQARYVGSTLWRFNDVVVHLHGHGFWPVEEPYPPAAYTPTKQSRRSGRRVS